MTPENNLVPPIVTQDLGAAAPASAAADTQEPVVADQSVSDGANVDAEESAAPAFQLPEDDSDLAGQETNPHVPAILQLRQALRSERQSLNDLKPLEAFKEFGSPEVVKQYVDLGRAFFTPVMKDGQPTIDPETGLQEITAAPAIEMLEQQAPGYVDNLLVDILNSKLPDGTARVNQIFQWYGLNPARYEDYKNIDKLLSQVNGVVPEEELEKIPELYRDTYKTLPQAVRDDLQIMSPLTRENYLRSHKAEVEKQGLEDQNTARQEQAKQATLARTQQEVQSQQLAYIAQVRKEEFDAIGKTLSEWKPSADESINDLHRGLVMGSIAALLDEDLRLAAEPLLKALGVTLDANFDQVIGRFVNESARYKAYEYYGSTMEANAAKDAANAARQQARAKLSSIATQIVKKLDGSRAAPTPSPTRPAVPAGQPASPSSGTPPAMTGFSDEWALTKARELGIIR